MVCHHHRYSQANIVTEIKVLVIEFLFVINCNFTINCCKPMKQSAVKASFQNEVKHRCK